MGPLQRRPITRTRETLACVECRKRKLKCDRNFPCGTCVRRDERAGCQYQRFANGPVGERERHAHAESRLEHLEQLVQQLARPQRNLASQPAPTDLSYPGMSNPELSGDTNGNGYHTPVHEELAYHGSTHWSAMLEDIEELRFAITLSDPIPANDDMQVGHEGDDFGLLFGAKPLSSIREVLSQYLPSRQESDRLTAAYFKANAIAVPFIHTTQFRRQYQVFWNDPSGAPPLWTSMLFSVYDVAHNTLLLGKKGVFENNKYSIAAAHCLALGRYYRPQRLAVESLLLYVQSKCWTRLDVPPDLGITFGLLVRLATRMGYHRDPGEFKMSPFEQEMRRRTWSSCLQADLLVSFHLGLPSNVQFPTWNTCVPRNLQDCDFDEDSVELPQARPDCESTDVLFYIAKHKLMTVFEKILRHTLSTDANWNTDVDELHAEITDTYAALPSHLRPRLMTDSVVDPSDMVVIRLCVYFIYQKSLCVLHRQHVARGRTQSIQYCYAAASNIVRYFVDTYHQLQPGGQIEMERWFMGAISWHDWLLGSVALCLVLCVTSQRGNLGTNIDKAESIKLLQRAQVVCAEQSSQSKDAERVRRLIEATISRCGDAKGSHPSMHNSNSLTEESAASAGPLLYTNGHLEQSPSLDGDDWSWNGYVEWPINDSSWAYLEQFLDLPSDLPIGDI